MTAPERALRLLLNVSLRTARIVYTTTAPGAAAVVFAMHASAGRATLLFILGATFGWAATTALYRHLALAWAMEVSDRFRD